MLFILFMYCILLSLANAVKPALGAWRHDPWVQICRRALEGKGSMAIDCLQTCRYLRQAFWCPPKNCLNMASSLGYCTPSHTLSEKVEPAYHANALGAKLQAVCQTGQRTHEKA